MRKIITKITLLAGIAILIGAASSAQAQCSSGYGGGVYANPYVNYYSSCQPQPVYGNCAPAPVYNYGYNYGYTTQSACPPNCGCSKCRPVRRSSCGTTSRILQYVRPRVVSPYSYSRSSIYVPRYGGYSSSCR